MGKKRGHPPGKPIGLKQLSTMISLNNLNKGSSSHESPPETSPATANPSPAPDSVKPSTRGGNRGGGNGINKSLASSPKAPATTTTTEQDEGKHSTPGMSGGKKRGSNPQWGGEEHEKKGGGTPRRKGSGARGMVVVEADEGRGAKDRAGMEVGSGTHPEKTRRPSTQVGGLGVLRGGFRSFLHVPQRAPGRSGRADTGKYRRPANLLGGRFFVDYRENSSL